MEKLEIPSGYQQVMPYLILKGAAAFIHFMENVFQAKETMRTMRDDKYIMHGEISVGGCTIMFADATDQFSEQQAGLFIYVDDADATFKVAVDEGATVIMEPADQPYGRSGGVKDPFGNTWWITSLLQ